ncbi:ribosome maturation factor RimM [Gracilibacillus caseinilyticus]|uniref:Ribosome maturation factor RimM n=1 Tax=Gracilibacillus caseinilyticus TaxID=2932256 RepID=A0ABY4EUF3_9BACI|nr:ribosome maturation factor RimM [Gracilibacillus caseinilyticus]UOQ47899.1 ribosome maturation factor RimM [Gracilibacillus caseinilyticus]
MDHLKVGKIVNTHGIKGEVRVIRITDFENRFETGTTLYVKTKTTDTLTPVTIDGHRVHKNFDLLHFQGYENINDVEQFKDTILLIRADQLTELEENEYYYHEIIGCEVQTSSGNILGKVSEILSPGANDVWVVKQKGKEYLIPYIEDIVKEVDIDTQRIIIEPMEGLLD